MKPLPTKRTSLFLYLVLIVLVIIIMGGIHRCQPESELSSANHQSEGDTIDVAIEYSPLSFYTYADTLGGFNYDLLRMVAESHGLKLKIHPAGSLSTALENLRHGHYDLLIADIPITNEYRHHYRFLEPVLLDRQVLVQRHDPSTGEVPVKSQLDLAGDTVWVIEGSSVVGRIRNLSNEIGDTIYIIEEPDYGAEQLLIMTALGEIRHAVINERVARGMLKDYPQLDASTCISFTQFQSWIASDRRPWLADSIDLWLRQIKETPDYHRLEKRYLK